jgi:hypothetical protein
MSGRNDSPGIQRSLNNVWEVEEGLVGMDIAHVHEMMAYVSRTNAAASNRKE